MNLDSSKIHLISNNQISSHTAAQLRALKVNTWKGWHCAAGIKSLYIQHDGVVYRSVCKIGGPVDSSIYDQNIPKLTNWQECNISLCFCGSDIQIPKVKNKEDIDKKFDLTKLNLEKVKLVSDPKELYLGNIHNQHPKQITWEIGRRCNYDCWYCAPSSHNNYEAHKTLGSFMHALNNLEKNWINGERVKFIFTGGEPTFNPNFKKFVKNINDRKHLIHTTTNGSHNFKYYSELIEFSMIAFSAHITSIEQKNNYNKFLDNLKAAKENNKNNLWIGVSIMFQPGKLNIIKKLYDDAKNILNKNINVNLLHAHENLKLLQYSQEELDWVRENG
jgi:MoaA/NifB/PqqE/SkfB family radical SAM enzyme